MDYLSTVSGGGYLGACVSSLLGAPEPDPEGRPASEPFPLRKEFGEAEPAALRHIRNGSNYLRPTGPLNQLRVPAILLRGVVLSLVALLPYVIAAVLFTRLAYAVLFPVLEERGWELTFLSTSSPFASSVLLFCALSASYPFVTAGLRGRFDWRRRNGYEIVISAALALSLVVLVAWPLASLIHFAVATTPRQAEMRLGVELAKLDGRVGIAVVVAVVALVVGAVHSERVERAVRVVGGAMVAVLSAMLPLGMYLGLCLTQVPPQRFVRDQHHQTVAPALEAGLVPDALLPVLEELSPEALDAISTSDRPEDPPPPLENIAVHPERPWRRWKVTATAAGKPIAYKVHHVHDGVMVVPVWLLDPGGRILLCVGLVLLFINLRFLDVNDTSPHGFFRDRLSRVFLIGLRGGEVVARDKLKLSDLNEATNPSAVAPYHLVNATLNLAGSNDPNLRGRNADFFLFSKRFVGSEHTGYCLTTDMERADPHLDLATAMAISAAAAAPQMGAISGMREFSVLLTVANVRLSYWLPNPGRAPASARRLSYVGPGPKYLFKEAIGATDTRSNFVNVSDGGHLENLGIYQLLRRHCRLIVAVDGEEDMGLYFGGLVTLLRYAWIDMGVHIDIDLGPLRRGAASTQARPWAVGRIRYRDGEEGTLVYIKARLRGDEGEVIRDYARLNPLFPHESTADQFFSETQLEAYRALGEHIARSFWRERVTDVAAIGEPPKETASAGASVG